MYQSFFIDKEQKFANHLSGLISFEYPIVDTTQCLAQPVAEEPGVYDKAVEPMASEPLYETYEIHDKRIRPK